MFSRQNTIKRSRVSRRGLSVETLEARHLLAAAPVITEFVADNNQSLSDGDGNFSDWIEIFNDGDTDIDLAGWRLTDDPANLTKWTFPSASLAAGEFLVVFASGSGVADAGGNLHTNFSLSAGGEYLALVDDGGVVVSQYAGDGSDFPAQAQDVSYGVVQELNQTTLVAQGAEAKVLIPQDDSLAAIWTGGDEAAFQSGGGDGSWIAGPTDIGYDISSGGVVALQSAVAAEPGLIHQYSFDGTDNAARRQDSKGSANLFEESAGGGSTLTYGAAGYDATSDAVNFTRNGDAGTALRSESVVDLDDTAITVELLFRPDDINYAGTGIAHIFHPSTPNGRGYFLQMAGPSQDKDDFEATFGNGSYDAAHTLKVLDDGVQEDHWYFYSLTAEIAGGNTTLTGYIADLTAGETTLTTVGPVTVSGTYTTAPGQLFGVGGRAEGPMAFVFPGSIDEAAVFDGALSAAAIQSHLDALVSGSTGDFGTDVGLQMRGENASAYVRIPFEVSDPTAFDSLTLNMKYDDGFVAYLNGTEVARSNAPQTPTFDAAATGEQTVLPALQSEAFEIAAADSLLTSGTNILAIHALNASADDTDFLVLPELIGNATATLTDQLRFFDPPTPGTLNTGGVLGNVADTTFSVDRGVFEQADLEPGGLLAGGVTITSATPGATIIYTLDGSEPTPDSGTQVEAPDANTRPTATVMITATTTLRAAAFKNEFTPTNVDTQTYVLVDQVVNQTDLDAQDRGFPSTWEGFTADYALDPEVTTDPRYAATIADDLQSIPTVSIVTDVDNLFGPTNGIYVNTTQAGLERPTSLEYFDPATGQSFQIDAGIRIQGDASVNTFATPKHSFRVAFRDIYGDSKLNFPLFEDSPVNRFDNLILGARYNNTWLHRINSPDGIDGQQRNRAQYMRDQWASETQRDMGNLAKRGSFVHLYLNGIYWGMYNLMERPDASFAAQNLGGDKDEYDVIRGSDTVGDSSRDAWNELMSRAGEDLSGTANYQTVTEMLDVEGFIDYMILNIYSGNWDWPFAFGLNKNWYALRHRVEGGKFQFISWDAEHILEDINEDRSDINDADGPGFLYDRMQANPEFRQLFADRIGKLMFNGGVLTAEANKDRWMSIADGIQSALVGESARWGDYRRDVHTIETGPFDLYTVDDYWLVEQQRLVGDGGYFDQRHAVVLQQFIDDGLFSTVDAPELLINGTPQPGGDVTSGDLLTITSTEGTIYYTTNGTDPRAPTESLSTVLLGVNAPAIALVPSVANGGAGLQTTDWTLDADPPNLASWSSGTTAIGYDNDPNGATLVEYDSLIGLDVETSMFNQVGSVLVRIPFTVADPAVFDTLSMRMRYDDGFVAYLNGVEIAYANAPGRDGDLGTLSWDSLATATHTDVESILPEVFDLTANLNSLQAGNNVLAIHGLNTSLDSSDLLVLPELVAGQINSSGLSPGAIEYVPGTQMPLTSSTRIKARAVIGDPASGVWSAVSDALFVVQTPLRITEIMYNPDDPAPVEAEAGFLDNDDFEYLELTNVGVASLNLAGISFTDGIEFTFPNLDLPAGERIVVVRDIGAFGQRYGAGITIAGEYGNGLEDAGLRKLANGGETIRLEDAGGGLIQEFRYDDKTSEGWYDETDGSALSLVLIDAGLAQDVVLWNDPASWRASVRPNGSPGVADRLPEDINGDGSVALTDLAIMQSQFGRVQTPFDGGDTTGDGVVSRSDTAALVRQFGRIYTAEVVGSPQAGSPQAESSQEPQAVVDRVFARFVNESSLESRLRAKRKARDAHLSGSRRTERLVITQSSQLPRDAGQHSMLLRSHRHRSALRQERPTTDPI